MNSTSLVIRLYYTHRLFMGFCCVSCEVLFLSLVALFHKDMPSWDLPLSGATLAWIQAATWTKEAAVPVAAGLALACVPGFVIKQVRASCFCERERESEERGLCGCTAARAGGPAALAGSSRTGFIFLRELCVQATMQV